MPRNKAIPRAQTAILMLGFALLLAGCLAPMEVCTPDLKSPCQCPDGAVSGTRLCNAEGTGFETSCICEGAPASQIKDTLGSFDGSANPDVSEIEDAQPQAPELPNVEPDTRDSLDKDMINDLGEDTQNEVEEKVTVDLPCNEDPWQCPPGQTCWLSGDNNDDGLWDGTFSCLNSRPHGTAGCNCDLKLGIPSCADGLYCLVLIGSNVPPPHCTPFCDNTNPDHPCPVGFYCGPVDVVDKTMHLCMSEIGQVDTKECSVEP